MVWISRGDGRLGFQVVGLVATAIVMLSAQCSSTTDPTLLVSKQAEADSSPVTSTTGTRGADALIIEATAADGTTSTAGDSGEPRSTETTETTERSDVSADTSAEPSATEPSASSTQIMLRERQGTFTFDPDGVGPDGGPIDVFYQRPPAGELSTAPILIVMPGNSRTAANYLDSWSEHADEYGAVLLVPLFPRDRYDTGAYNRGNLLDADGRPNRPERWTFAVIETLYASVAEAIGSTTGGYHLYGHSAGAQFVHRFMLFMADHHVIRAVSANAGWYTVPDPGIAFPYGVAGGPSVSMTRALREPLVILAGIGDDDPDAAGLRTTDEAGQQGQTRYERAIHFYDKAKAAADGAGVELRWTLHIVPGVAHSNHDMAPFAAKVLFNP